MKITKTKFHKDLKFLKPFFLSASGLVPIERVKSVRGFKVSVNKEVLTDASIIRFGNNKTFTINMRTHSNYVYSHKQKYEFIAETLINFAHELAHVLYWDHTPEHFKLQAQIMIKFSGVLKKLKIEDTYLRIN